MIHIAAIMLTLIAPPAPSVGSDPDPDTPENPAAPPLTASEIELSLDSLLYSIEDSSFKAATDSSWLLPTIETLASEAEQIEAPEELRYRIAFTIGSTALGLDLYDRAIVAFREADLLADSAKASTDARFNLGHAFYRSALEKVSENDKPPTPRPLPEQIELLTASAAAFRAAYGSDPANAEASRNTEIIRRMIKERRETLERQQELAERLQELAQQAADLAEQQQTQSDQSEKSTPNESESLSESQSGLDRRTEDLFEQMKELLEDSQPGDPGRQQMQESLQELAAAQQAQQQAQQSLGQQDPGQASEQQQEAADRLRAAAGEAADASRNNGAESEEQEGDPNAGDPNEKEPGDGGDEESQTDQSSSKSEELIEREERLREARKEAIKSYLSKTKPAEKDW